MYGTEVNCIVSAIEWDLKLKVIPIILRSVGDLANKLRNMSVGLTSLLSFLFCLDELIQI